eukprot:scpid87918/ scgid4458/ 
MKKQSFDFLSRRYGHLLQKEVTNMRRTIQPDKRLAIILYYVCHGETFSEIAALFHLGISTVSEIIHEGIAVLQGNLVHDSIIFPIGKKLVETMANFEQLSNLPMCAGAVDGTFVQIVKPVQYGDIYWCYKQMSAILLLACVDSHGLFTFVDVGAPGSVGDAAVFNNSRLKANCENGQWLNYQPWQCGDSCVRPYLVGDSAFALSSCLMKIYGGAILTAEQKSFNYGQIRTRRVVECAFGRLKERFVVMQSSNSNNPADRPKAHST